jgi:predicted  nucleic acid-binding Zn-ribbon protein
MKNWHLELQTLERQKQNDESNKRLELVKDEVNELNDLENEFTIAGTELEICKKSLIEISDRNAPIIEELTETLTALKSSIQDVDVDWQMKELVIKNSSFEIANQQTLVNELAARKEDGDLEFAQYMAANQTLIELKQTLETEKGKLTDLKNRYYELKVTPDLANLSRRLSELRTEVLNAQSRVSNTELDRRAINRRMNFLRSAIAKNAGNNSSTSP